MNWPIFINGFVLGAIIAVVAIIALATKVH
jgi:hypothetical protein